MSPTALADVDLVLHGLVLTCRGKESDLAMWTLELRKEGNAKHFGDAFIKVCRLYGCAGSLSL